MSRPHHGELMNICRFCVAICKLFGDWRWFDMCFVRDSKHTTNRATDRTFFVRSLCVWCHVTQKLICIAATQNYIIKSHSPDVCTSTKNDLILIIFFVFFSFFLSAKQGNIMVNLLIGWTQQEKNYHFGKVWSIDRTFGSKDVSFYVHHWIVLQIRINYI